MRLRVSYKRIMQKGEPKIEIVAVHGLKKDELPTAYVTENPAVWLTQDGRRLWGHNGVIDVGVGDIISNDKFAEIVAFLKKCGDRLHRMNKEIKKIEKHWVDGKIRTLEI